MRWNCPIKLSAFRICFRLMETSITLWQHSIKEKEILFLFLVFVSESKINFILETVCDSKVLLFECLQKVQSSEKHCRFYDCLCVPWLIWKSSNGSSLFKEATIICRCWLRYFVVNSNQNPLEIDQNLKKKTKKKQGLCIILVGKTNISKK